MRRAVLCLVLALAMIALKPAAKAEAQEIKEITLAQQFGAIFIPLMAMENLQLIEKQAAAQGIGDLKVNWAKMAGPSVMVDAIISGNLHFSAQGVPSLALMWDRTKGGVGVKAISAITNTDIYSTRATPASSRSATSPTRTVSPCRP
jgi:NitT/TauT family transport system substrate-binding protein